VLVYSRVTGKNGALVIFSRAGRSWIILASASNERTGVGVMFTLRLRNLLIASFLLFGSAGAQSAQLITNGGFESDGAGWTVSLPNVSFTDIAQYGPCCAPFGVYPYGSAAAFFGDNDTPGGSLFQDIATTAGSFYTLSFAYGAISETRLQALRATVFNGPGLTTLASIGLFAIGTQDLSHMMNEASIMFQAQSGLTRISFQDTSSLSGFGTTSVDGLIDAVSVLGPAPIPEPSTYVLMLVGMAIVAFTVRRRSRRAALSA
jgi:hypothetical protein